MLLLSLSFCNEENTILAINNAIQICLKKQNNQGMTQKELIKWCEQELGVKYSWVFTQWN